MDILKQSVSISFTSKCYEFHNYLSLFKKTVNMLQLLEIGYCSFFSLNFYFHSTFPTKFYPTLMELFLFTLLCKDNVYKNLN